MLLLLLMMMMMMTICDFPVQGGRTRPQWKEAGCTCGLLDWSCAHVLLVCPWTVPCGCRPCPHTARRTRTQRAAGTSVACNAQLLSYTPMSRMLRAATDTRTPLMPLDLIDRETHAP